MYRIDESLMDADEVRGFLCARFDDQSVQLSLSNTKLFATKPA